MKTLSATRFRKRGLALIDAIGSEGVVITKCGKPVARLVPYEAECGDLIDILKGKIRVREDVMTTALKWNAES